jgi:hypothetical protein
MNVHCCKVRWENLHSQPSINLGELHFQGVLLSHTNLHINILGMIDAWRWVGNDRILHSLPLNHVHGVVNALLTPLYCGATVYMLPKFDSKVRDCVVILLFYLLIYSVE